MGRESGGAGWTGLAEPQDHWGRNLGQGGGCGGLRCSMTEGGGLADVLHVSVERGGRQEAQPRLKVGGGRGSTVGLGQFPFAEHLCAGTLCLAG